MTVIQTATIVVLLLQPTMATTPFTGPTASTTGQIIITEPSSESFVDTAVASLVVR